MYRDTPFAINETYHIYNRGAHKEKIFISEADYGRFLLLLFLTNTDASIDMRRLFAKYKGESFVNIFEKEKQNKPLVDVMAYALMPNHFHLVVRQREEQGISKFMRKIFTAYAMYFNIKYNHSGVLFQGPFKSKHIDTEAYFRYIFSYVHLNPLSLIESGWEEVGVQDKNKARAFMECYAYSSYVDYTIRARPESVILAKNDLPTFLQTQNDLEDLLFFTKESPL